MPALTPTELFDLLELHLARAASHCWWRRRSVVVWFTVPSITIGAHTWTYRRRGPDGYGYTLAQVREMRDALLPILAEYGHQIVAALNDLRHPPENNPRRG